MRVTVLIPSAHLHVLRARMRHGGASYVQVRRRDRIDRRSWRADRIIPIGSTDLRHGLRVGFEIMGNPRVHADARVGVYVNAS